MATLKNICKYWVRLYEKPTSIEVAKNHNAPVELEESHKLVCSGFLIFV